MAPPPLSGAEPTRQANAASPDPHRPLVRVCYVLAHFHPVESGAERQAMAQGVELVRRGHEVHVLTMHRPGQPSDSVVEGLQVHRWIRPVRIGPLFGLSFVAGVIRALRRLRPRYDVVHTHQALWEAVSAGLARPLLRGAPTLIQPASSGYYGEAEELARTKGFPLLRKAALNNTFFAAISADIERQWLELGVPADRIVRTASGVDARRYRPGPSALEPTLPPRPRVVFTGRLHPQKNLDLLLEAWPSVAARTGATLMLVGHGPERDRLGERTVELGIAGSVHFAGPVPDPAEHLRAADAFALPSVAEGMSNSLLEAMATGLPCLASDIGGNTDLLAGGVGLLVEPEVPAWSDALIRVLTDRALADRLSRAARGRVEAEYALPVVVDRYLALYDRLLGRA